MKKSLSIVFGVLLLSLVSWGPEGHSTVASIAQKHLTPKAQSAISSILNGQPMSSVSSWADQVKNNTTAPWHFLNLPAGLSFEQFAKGVKNQQTPNLYSALNILENDIVKTSISASRKQEDLKYIIHLIGDAHQPMHVSHAEDRGGNLIPVSFLGKATNLHSLWDGLLIKHDQSDFSLLSSKIDNADENQIGKWQHDDMLVWLFESYQISTRLYSEVHPNIALNQAYYDAHIPIVENQLEKGGIRLAGVLNKLFQ